MKTVRCAIYTRKSSEEGLEQAFNSLDAQREACAAYILSQASEGWTALPDIYDDGGLSGGTLERPALQRLLAEVSAGRVDIIVVYKVDRLTRSLLDFSKLVEAFDKAETSFVSVTQSFNTTTSMGRLTLNMLLSFAQFEREVTAERIRDKIAASKAKGMWMGGTPPLGYAPDGRSLKIVEDHAALIRDIYARYLDLGNVRLVMNSLNRDRIRTPERIRASSGTSFGNVPFGRGQIYTILRCPTYVGEIHHREHIFPALHQPIIVRETWERVQLMLSENRQGERSKVRVASSSPLAGLLVDATGQPMLVSHASKKTVRYRYYASDTRRPGNAADIMRIPALELETAVARRISALFDDPLALAATAWLSIVPADYARLFERCKAVTPTGLGQERTLLRTVVRQVRVHDSRIEIDCDTAALAAMLGAGTGEGAPSTLTLTSNVRLTRSGRAMRLIHDSGAAVASTPDPSLLRLVIRARGWWTELRKGEINTQQLAAQANISPAYLTRALRLAFLAPSVIEAIVAGTLRSGVDAAALTATDAIDPNWARQAGVMLPA